MISQLEKFRERAYPITKYLTTSYPGHSILTEDLGTIYGEDDCKCGKNGKYFKVHGRQLNSEPRGCSDVIK